MVDRRDLYPGAVVTAKSMVLRIEGDRVLLKAIDDNLPGQPFSSILSVEDRPLAVDDEVEIYGDAGRIALIHGDEAVLIWTDATPATINGHLSPPIHVAKLSRFLKPAPAEERAP